MNIIEKISKECISLFDSNYNAVMVTNGYLLTKDVAVKLKSLKINTVQITIDGPPEIHDSRRNLKNGNPTCLHILENINNICDILDITIRINVDFTNLSKLHCLFDYLDVYNLKNRVTVYIAPVQNINANCNSPNCLSNLEFSDAHIQFLNLFAARGYLRIHVPQCDVGLCGAVNLSSFVIAPNGDLYKCWNDIGVLDELIGNIHNGPSYKNVYLKWLKYSPFNNKDCYQCALLPICMGGCPYFPIKSKYNNCHYLKNNIINYVKLLCNQN